MRAGIVDLDGLKLLDLKQVELTSEGELANAARAHGAIETSEALVVRWRVIVQPGQPTAGAAARGKSWLPK